MHGVRYLLDIHWVPSARTLGPHVQAVQGLHVVRVQLEIIDFGIGLDPAGRDRLGQRDIPGLVQPSSDEGRRQPQNAPFLQAPADQDLTPVLTVLLRDTIDRSVV